MDKSPISKRFTVVTPNYNMAMWLEETILSVLENMGPDDEYFVVDGGSTDGSLDIIRRYESRLTGWVSEPDNGYADAISKGLSRASGKYLCWINSGDRYLLKALDAAVSALESDGADLIYGDDFYIDEEGKILQLSIGPTSRLAEVMVFGRWGPLQDACFWRRATYELIGGIDRSLKVAADYDLFLRLSCRARAKYVPKTFSAFRRHEGQQSVSKMALYRNERDQCCARELERMSLSPIVAKLKIAYWRTRVAIAIRARGLWMGRWRMSGRAVSQLPATSYRELPPT